MAGLSSCLRDDRQAGKVDHSLRELVAQRVFACGYPDANDSARLSVDPIHKLLLDRDPIDGRDLASQPTLSRFENGVGVKDLYRSGEFLAETVIRRHAKRLRHRAYRVTIDLGSDRRSHARGAAVTVFTRPLRYLVLSAGDGIYELQRRSRTVSLRGSVTAR